jgi:NADH-ubiquinone oxidoreductase chain 3
LIKFLLIILIVIVFRGLLYIINTLLRKKLLCDYNKFRPFECGFLPKELPRTPLSLRFFLIALVFLVFDVELILLFPLISCLGLSAEVSSLVMFIVFILALLIGLYYEINMGRLN